jgi:hypothetical protein
MTDETNAGADARKNFPASARDLIATARNDITLPYFSTVLQPTDDTLIQRGEGKGLKLYDEIERDTHAYAVLQKRKFALVGRQWELEPASDDPADVAAAAMIEETLASLPFDQLCLDLLDATLKGYAVAEIVWTRRDGRFVPEKIVAHDQRRFVFGQDWRPRLLTMQAPSDGIELPEKKFLVHRFGVKGNNPYGLGLGTRMFWPVLFKREGVAFWMHFLEKYASPTPVARYPQGTLPEDQRKLLSALEEMVQRGALVVPMGTGVEFLEAARSGQVSYEGWCDYWDRQMSLCVFGSTLATYVEGQGSRAASETHKEAEEQIIDADADLLADTLRAGLFQWLIDYNAPGARAPSLRRPRAKNQNAEEDLRKKRTENAKAELEALFDFAGRVPPENFADLAAALAGIDLLPQVPIEVLRKLAPHVAQARINLVEAARRGDLPTPADPNDPAAARVRQIAFAGGVGSDAHDHGLGALADQLDAFAAPMIEGWTGQIRAELDAAIARGEGLTQFADRLLTLEPKLAVDPLGRVLGLAMEAAELSGRGDVKDEIERRERTR